MFKISSMPREFKLVKVKKGLSKNKLSLELRIFGTKGFEST